MKIFVFLGAGKIMSSVRETLDLQEGRGKWGLAGILDDAPKLAGTKVDGVEVFGPITRPALQKLAASVITHAVVTFTGMEHQRRRQTTLELLKASGIASITVIHPTAFVSPTAIVGEGCIIEPGAIIMPHARLGTGCVIGAGAIVSHDDELESNVFIAPGAVLGGSVRVGKGAFVGVGACIRDGVTVGEDSVCGMGATVIHDVAPNTVALGTPAKDQGRRYPT